MLQGKSPVGAGSYIARNIRRSPPLRAIRDRNYFHHFLKKGRCKTQEIKNISLIQLLRYT
ncbi:MAG: hypothetical protein Q8R42_09750, partial [Desulfocapsaceae bacterium]|nr:hypothetical protein [Desulfocapsaceae bacterium]